MSVTNGYQVYVIRNATGKFYIGLSENVQIRLRQHNQGVSKWTRYRGPWSLVWKSESLTLSQARKPENRLKRQKGGRGFRKLMGLPGSSGSSSRTTGFQFQGEWPLFHFWASCFPARPITCPKTNLKSSKCNTPGEKALNI